MVGILRPKPRMVYLTHVANLARCTLETMTILLHTLRFRRLSKSQFYGTLKYPIFGMLQYILRYIFSFSEDFFQIDGIPVACL